MPLKKALTLTRHSKLQVWTRSTCLDSVAYVLTGSACNYFAYRNLVCTVVHLDLSWGDSVDPTRFDLNTKMQAQRA